MFTNRADDKAFQVGWSRIHINAEFSNLISESVVLFLCFISYYIKAALTAVKLQITALD